MGAGDQFKGSYEGSAFIGGVRVVGTIRMSVNAVRFSSPEANAELPVRGLTIRRGGAGDRLIFFEHPQHPTVSIYTSDAAVLRDPALGGHATQVRSIRRAGQRRTAGWVVLLTIIVTALAALVLARGALVRLAADQVPPGLERKLGDVAMRQILLTSKIESNPAITAPVNEILQHVVRGVGPTPYEFRLLVIDDPTINAFALPGGQLAIHTGLISKASSADEIAGVLGHEIAHVTERHSLRQMISTIGLLALVQTVLGDVSALVAAAAKGGADLLVLSFSREAETEADERGVEFLVAAGLDPRGIASFFETLRKEEGVAGAMPALLSTHPATAERVAHTRGLLSGIDMSRLRSVPVDLTAAKAAIGE